MKVQGVKTLFLMVLLCSILVQTVRASEMIQKNGSVVFIKSIEEFNRYLKSGNFLVVYFGSPTCGPCKVFHDTYHAMAKEYPDLIFLEVSYGAFNESESLLTKYAVRSFPTFVFFDKSGIKKSSFSGTSERTKAKIAGEIVMLKEGKCVQAVVTEQQPQQHPSQPQSMMQQASRQTQQPVMQQPVVQQPMIQQPVLQQTSVPQPRADQMRLQQQPSVQQNVQPIITYHTASDVAASAGTGTAQLRSAPTQNLSRQPRQSGRRRLGRRQRQRVNNIEYQ